MKSQSEGDYMEVHQKFYDNVLQDQNEIDYIEPSDNNILVASWIDDWGTPQKDFEDRIVFYNSETLLNQQNIFNHFQKEHMQQPMNSKKCLFFCNILTKWSIDNQKRQENLQDF